MAYTAQSIRLQVEQLLTKVKFLINADLKEICRRERLAVSGIKAVLQKRVIDHIEAVAKKGDAAHLSTIQYRIEHRGNSPPNTTSAAGAAKPAAISPPAQPYPVQNGYPRPSIPTAPMRHAPFLTRLHFRESVFYEIKEPLTHVLDLTVLPNNRQTLQTNLVLVQHNVDRLKYDPNLRIMLYCTADTSLGQYSKLDISFPNQIEVKVNSTDVKSNFKGLKNRPGSTRPADITDLVRISAGYTNQITVTYALTSKKYSLLVQLVKMHSVDDLVKRIQAGKYISKQQVISELVVKANDPDLVATSTVMSLKDPLSRARMTLPCRSTVCTHNQCFDAKSFLQLQEQAPTWTCPVCNKSISFEALAVDHYVQEILNIVPSSIDQVTIEPNGTWSQTPPSDGAGTHGTHNRGNVTAGDSDSDDLVEISDHRIATLKTEAAPTPISLVRTPPLSSREASVTTSASRLAHGSKRTSEVVDLTLSSDDDDQRRPVKRPAYGAPNGSAGGAGGGVRLVNGPSSARPNGVAPFRLGSHGVHSSSQQPSPTMQTHQLGYQRPPLPGYGSAGGS